MRTALFLTLALILATPAWAQPGGGDPAGAAETLARGKDTTARMEAAKLLGASKDPRALGPLVAALGDASRDVRWAAVEALGELGDRRAVPALVEYLKRPEAYRWGKRLVAAALGAIGDPSAVEPLQGLLADEDPFVRRLAAISLLRTGDARARARVAQFVKDSTDETLPTVRRELARAEESGGRRTMLPATPRQVASGTPSLRPHEWAGVRVGGTRLAEVRERLGQPLQETPDFMLYRGERFPGPLRVESVVLNADTEGLIESIFVFPAWGTLDRDVRAVLGQGKVLSYAEFLKLTGRTAYGAGTRAGGKLHYLPPETMTESYTAMGVLVVYDSAEAAARDRLVKLLIIH